MDFTFGEDIAETGKILKFDRISVLKFKYSSPKTPCKTKSSYHITVEVIYDWLLNSLNQHNQKDFNYKISESSLTLHGWKNSPAILKINNKKQLDKLETKQEINTIFDIDTIQAVLIIPLFIANNKETSETRTLGLLVIQNINQRHWKTAEIEMAKWMGKQISTSIINQQTVTKVQSIVEERTSQLQVSLEVQAKLGQKLKKSIEELTLANKVKDEFISSLSDALKTPLSNIKMGIQMLKLMNKNEKSIRYLEILSDECEKEINLINNLLTLQSLESHQFIIEWQRIYLAPLLDEIINCFSLELKLKKNQLLINNQEKYIYGDLNCLKLILKELISNACKFSHDKTQIILEIYPQNSDIIIAVTNHGFPLSTSEQKLIFQPFYQGQNVEKVTNSGTGLGLALVYSLIQNLKGTINVSSFPTQKYQHHINTFTISFPQTGME